MWVEVDFQPLGRRVRVTPGTTVLVAAQEAGVGLSAVCGGSGTCGSCRVRLAPGAVVSPVTLMEKTSLGEAELRDGMRLACQVQVLGKTRIDVPRESLTAPQRTQLEGEDIPVELSPPLEVYDLSLAPASQTDPRADWERFVQALAGAGAPEQVSGALDIVRRLPGLLRDNDWSARVVLREKKVVSVATPRSAVWGLALDVGTTKVAGYLVDLLTGKTLAMGGIMNPQIAYGEDVMARIAYTMQHEDGLSVLQKAILGALNDLARDLCADADRLSPGFEGTNAQRIVECVVVGNTAMHHILLGLPVRQLGVSPFVAAASSAMDVRADEVGLLLAPGAIVHFLPNIAGFVGADHVAMLLATRTHRTGGVVVSVDIGTNTEATLDVGGRMMACSTASGPAFEGAHVGDGMRAAEGAIERVRIADHRVEYQTIGGGRPVGVCGSGILDAISQLKGAGVILPRGTFNRESGLVRMGRNGPEVVLAHGEATRHGKDIVLTRKDVSEIQLAKGAIRAGIEILLKEAALSVEAIDRFIIAGAFGTYIDVESAVHIGMFPPLPLDRFRQVGNAAGMGAKLALLSSALRAEAQQTARSVDYLELSTSSRFQEEFAAALQL